MNIFENKSTKNMSDYDAVISIDCRYINYKMKSGVRSLEYGQPVELGRVPFYKDSDEDLSEFINKLAGASSSLIELYDSFPDGEVSVKIHIQQVIYNF